MNVVSSAVPVSTRAPGGQTNAYLLGEEPSVLVDPAARTDALDRLVAARSVEHVVLTHTHPDHVGNLDAVKDAFDVDAWGFDPGQPGVDHAIADGDTVQLGDHEYVALHTPGHKDDHLCFHSPEAGVLIAGDLVFAGGGFGRTDLAEGNRTRLVESIDTVLGHVEEGEDLYVGHGPSVDGEARAHVELAAQAARMG